MERDNKQPNRTSVPTSIRLSPAGNRIWEKLAEKMGLSKVGVLETALRRLAKEEGVKDDPPEEIGAAYGS